MLGGELLLGGAICSGRQQRNRRSETWTYWRPTRKRQEDMTVGGLNVHVHAALMALTSNGAYSTLFLAQGTERDLKHGCLRRRYDFGTTGRTKDLRREISRKSSIDNLRHNTEKLE